MGQEGARRLLNETIRVCAGARISSRMRVNGAAPEGWAKKTEVMFEMEVGLTLIATSFQKATMSRAPWDLKECRKNQC